MAGNFVQVEIARTSWRETPPASRKPPPLHRNQPQAASSNTHSNTATMALRGDDEMYSLLALMGGQALQTTSVTSSSVKPPAAAASVGKLLQLQPDEKTKSKKRKGDRRKSTCTSSSRGSLGTRTCGRKKISFADSRMTQNCLEWPRSDDGELVLDLGSGLLHNCNGYSMRGSDGTHHDQGGIYGFSTCQSCGKSAATHELCISSSWMSDERTTNHPRSIMSVASIVVASRNFDA